MVSETNTEKSDPKPRFGMTSLWVARIVSVLGAVGAFEGFAANGHPKESIPILVIYTLVLALLLRKRPSPSAQGMQLGLGTALTGLSLGTFALIAGPAALVVTDFPSVLSKLLLVGFLNLPMILSGVIGRWRAKDQRAIVQFWASFLIVSILASGYTYLSWWRPFAGNE